MSQALLAGDDPAGNETVAIEVTGRFPGRIVLAEPDGTLYLGRNYDIFRSDDAARSWQPVTSMPRDLLRRVANPSRLLCRLIRQEVRALTGARHVDALPVGADQGPVGGPGERVMRRSVLESGELPVMPPMRIAQGPGGEILWGEYGSPKTRRPMRLFVSRDRGESFQVVRTFDDVLHFHNVVWDEGQGHFWVLSGDFDPEPGIGKLSADLERFEWFVKGEQRYRAVEIFDFGDRLVYATDTQLEQNALISLDKSTGKLERLREFDGSCIYAARFGGIYAISTSVEPSAVNRTTDSELWLSRDGEHWKRAWRGRKDRWNADYLQFGSVVLPSGRTDRELIVFSGQAVEGLDGKTCVARLAPGAL